MKSIHKFVWALMVSLALLLSGCGGSSGGGAALSAEDQAKMERAETQVAALKMAYEAAVAALETLEDDFSDATQAEIDDAQAKLDALKTKVTEAVDVSAEDKAKYSAQAIETRLAGGKKSARLALAAEVAEKARMERAVPQTAALKAAYEAVDAALKTLESDASDATRAEVDDVETKLAALKTAVAAAVDVSEDVKAMYLAETIETRLAAAKQNARLALEADDAKIAREQAEAAAKAERTEDQTTRLKAAYDAAVAAVETLEDDTDDATQAELKDAKDKLADLVTLRGNDPDTGTPDVSAEVKGMYPADALQTRLDRAEKLARLALARDKIKVDAETAIMVAGEAIDDAKEAIDDAKEAIEGAETAVEDLNFIHIQTGSGDTTVKQDVEVARMAYDKARKAYETAKMTYDKAKEKHDMDRDAADTTEKVYALKTAADAAKEAADTAKEAADTAKTNAEMAKMDAETGVAEGANLSALQYTDGAYHVGDMSINPTTIGKAKATEGDKTTGFVEIIGGDSLSNVGKAGTKEKVGQMALAPSEFAVGGKYDSADDNTRLRLITHYVSNPGEPGATERVGVYYFQTDDSEDNLLRSTPVEPGVVDEQNYPGSGYGFVTDGGNKQRRITKLSYNFPIYPVTDSNGNAPTGNLASRNLVSYHILDAATAKPINPGSESVLYTYLEGGNDWQYLHLVRTGTDNDGTPTYVFRKLSFLSKAGSYPKLNAYEYINYGIWSTLDEDGETSADLGIGFVRELKAGGMTTPDNLPTTGSATYHGKWVANILSNTTDGNRLTEHHGRAKVTAEFAGDRTVTVNLLKGDNFDGNRVDAVGQNMGDYGTLAVLEGTITSGTSQFKGTKVTNVVTDVIGLTEFGSLSASATGSTGEEPAYTGTFSGAFFGNRIGDEGENASEVGGVFDFTSEKNDDGMPKNGAFRGSFGGVNKQPAADDDDS